MEGWSYERMYEEADLVAIARLVSTTRTSEEALLTDVRPPAKVVVVLSEFKVLLVLKGSREVASFQLRHYWHASPADREYVNAPELIDTSKPGTQFLLFLKRDEDKRYVPVSSQTDAGLISVVPVAGGAD